MKKLIRVTWTETHVQDIWARDEDEAFELVDVNTGSETYKKSSVIETRILEEAQPDDMGRAKAERESAA